MNSDSFLGKIRWFYKNLELQVEDIDLERRRKSIVHYFDTADVQGALLGMQDLYQERFGRVSEFNYTEFDGKRTLIRSLLSSKRLGQIRLLPPHQDELITKLKRGFPHWSRSQWKEKVTDFVGRVGLSPERYLSPALSLMNSEQLADVLRGDMEQAERLFKVFQNLLPWHSRLGIWQRKELIRFESTKIDPRILRSQDFKLLEQKLNLIQDRRGKYINNFTDALAWAYLSDLVEQFNRELSDVVPRFYSPHSKFSLQTVLKVPLRKELSAPEKELVTRFNCRSKTGSLSVLRDDDYYLFKVALRSYSFSESYIADNNAEKDQNLITLYEQVRGLLHESHDSDKEPLPPETLNKLSYEGRPLGDIVNELEKATFFKSEWLRADFYSDLLEALKGVGEYLREVDQMRNTLGGDKYQEAVVLIIDDIRRGIKQEVDAFSTIPTFWNALNNEMNNLGSRINRENPAFSDYYRDFGLLRYGFPEKIRDQVRIILEGLCSGDEDKIENHYVEFIQHYLRARFYEREDVDSLMISTAVLLALRMFQEVYELLKDNERPHFSLRIVYGDLLLNPARKVVFGGQKDPWQRGRKIIEDLRQMQASRTISPAESAEMCAGLAYLFYHAWLSKVGDAQWRQVSLAATQRADAYKRWQDLIDSATRYAARAFEILNTEAEPSTWSEQLKVYALNEYVFFLVEGAPEKRMSEIKEAAELLVGYHRDARLWQFRCDDTLARVHHRIAVKAQTESEWQEATNDALRLIEEARSRSDRDEEIEGYYELLKLYKARGFSKRKN